MNILQINSSARREGSHSTRLADRIVERLRDADPDATLTVRDLDRHTASGARRGRARRPVHARRAADAGASRRAWRWTTR